MVVEKGPDWWVKIADFGISKRRHELTSLQTLQRGTFGFAAPEAVGFSGENLRGSLAAALDMWSLGAVAFQIMTNTGAFPNFVELAEYCSGKKGFPTARLRAHGVSPDGQDFVASLMRLKPEERLLADEARQHPWIRAGMNPESLAALSGAVGFPATSEPSPTWSFSEYSEHTARPFDIPPRPASAYRSPYVEDCSEESEEEKQETAPEGVIMTPANSIHTAPRTQNPSPKTTPRGDQATVRTATVETALPQGSGAGQEWRKYPLVLVQTENDMPKTDNDQPPTQNDLPQTQNDLPQTRNDLPQTRNDRPQRRQRRTKSVHFKTETGDDDGHTKNVHFNTEAGDDDDGRVSGDVVLEGISDPMAIDGLEEPLHGSEWQVVDEYESSRRFRKAPSGDLDISEVPAWDTAYWRYTKKLRRATEYIQKRRRGGINEVAWRETMEQSLEDL